MQPPVTRWKTPVRTTALSLLAVVAAVGVGAGPALAADGNVAWTVRTASNDYGEARSSYSYNVNPGGAVEDAMVVANRGPAPLTLSVYAGRRLHHRRRPARPAHQGQEVRSRSAPG